MLLAVKLWAVAHLMANGTLPDVLLFGAFLIWAVADRIVVKRRTGAGARATPKASSRPWNDMLAVSVGLALYLLFLWRVHWWLVGVAPLASLQ